MESARSGPTPEDMQAVSARRELRLALAFMVLIWGAGYTVVKVTLLEIAPANIAAARVLIATLSLFLVLRASGRNARLDIRAVPMMVLLGFTGVAANQLLFVVGLNLTVPSHSSLVIATGPVWVLLLAVVFLDERIGPQKIAGIVLSFAGVAALTVHSDFSFDPHYLAGDLITMSGSFSFAIFTVIGRKTVQRYGVLKSTAYSHLCGALLLLPFALIIRTPNPRPLTGVGLFGVLYLAILSSTVAYLIFNRGLRDLGASSVAILNYFQPLLAILISIALGQEPLTAQVFAGGAMILAGIFLAERA
ncbi:MAG: DMT family transporter [Acidobacteriota bacterium]